MNKNFSNALIWGLNLKSVGMLAAFLKTAEKCENIDTVRGLRAALNVRIGL